MRAMLRFVALGAFCLVGALTPAAAQNYDANLQVRSGVFGQWGLFRGEAQVPGRFENFSFSSLAVGLTAGLEYVRPSSWSYGIEIDGGVLSGEEVLAPATIYTPNYFASLRLRLGRHLRPDLFVYGTLGYGVLGAEIRTPTKVTGTKGGIAAGFGFERDFGPGLWFAEYMFNDYGALGIDAQQTSFDPRSHAVRFGIKFKVGHDHYHDDVADRIGRRHLERYGDSLK